MECTHVMADPERIDTYYSNLKELIKNVPRSFVPNMDETGFFDSVDAS
jgi:hypothetical protein